MLTGRLLQQKSFNCGLADSTASLHYLNVHDRV